jgi:hypothetical protein
MKIRFNHPHLTHRSQACTHGRGKGANAPSPKNIGREFPAFAGITQPGIKKWLDNKWNEFQKLSPPDSRQHFDQTAAGTACQLRRAATRALAVAAGSARKSFPSSGWRIAGARLRY